MSKASQSATVHVTLPIRGQRIGYRRPQMHHLTPIELALLTGYNDPALRQRVTAEAAGWLDLDQRFIDHARRSLTNQGLLDGDAACSATGSKALGSGVFQLLSEEVTVVVCIDPVSGECWPCQTRHELDLDGEEPMASQGALLSSLREAKVISDQEEVHALNARAVKPVAGKRTVTVVIDWLADQPRLTVTEWHQRPPRAGCWNDETIAALERALVGPSLGGFSEPQEQSWRDQFQDPVLGHRFDTDLVPAFIADHGLTRLWHLGLPSGFAQRMAGKGIDALLLPVPGGGFARVVVGRDRRGEWVALACTRTPVVLPDGSTAWLPCAGELRSSSAAEWAVEWGCAG